MSDHTSNQESLSAVDAAERTIRMVVLGVLASIAPGILVGGIGSRLIMRILAMVNEEKAGVMTQNGNISGEITTGGTIGLIIFVGLASGIIGGLVYVVIRRWLPGSGLLKGAAFGLVLLCFSGNNPRSLATLFDSDNVDFALFGPILSVGLFALLILLFGVGVSLIVERIDHYVPPLFNRLSITVLGYLLIAGICSLGLSQTVPVINAIL